MTNTSLHKLDGVSYWVIEDPREIQDFINTNVRKEWEADRKSEGRDPTGDPWLATLSKRKWRLEVVKTQLVRLNPEVMNYVDDKRSYKFKVSLEGRSKELRKAIEVYASVIWPIIVDAENMELVDGYCRLATLREMKVTRTYAYMGSLGEGT